MFWNVTHGQMLPFKNNQFNKEAVAEAVEAGDLVNWSWLWFDSNNTEGSYKFCMVLISYLSAETPLAGVSVRSGWHTMSSWYNTWLQEIWKGKDQKCFTDYYYVKNSVDNKCSFKCFKGIEETRASVCNIEDWIWTGETWCNGVLSLSFFFYCHFTEA